MMTTRLQQQFIRLWNAFNGQPVATTLEELSGILFCSRRHVRSLLNAMQQQDWLHWDGVAGRGKRSQLTFIASDLSLKTQRANMLLEQDRIDQLIELIGDRDTVRNMLVSQLGRDYRQGKHIMRVLYYRPLNQLLPRMPLRRTEIHLVRQLFNGLTRINEENGEVESDIAHFWQQLSPTHWRFFLRPAVHFHHGRALNCDDVIQSIRQLKDQPLFAHIDTVSSTANNIVDIHLLQPDHWLPCLMSRTRAMILPQEWPTIAHFSSRPIGTGPYKIVKSEEHQLKIQAFDDYFGFRALIDEVNIWILPELAEEISYSGVQVESGEGTQSPPENALEEGCYFLLLDRRSPHGQDDEIRHWLSQVINPISLLSRATAENQHIWSPAYGLLPRWHHISSCRPTPPPANLKQLTLSYYSYHSEFPVLAELIAGELAKYGITVKKQCISYQQWQSGSAESDLWLGSANFYLPLEFSLFASLYELPLFHHCTDRDLSQDRQQWHQQQLNIADWAKQLVCQQQIYPLFHHWLQLNKQRSMRGVRMNTLGWFDFKSAWFVPENLE